MPARRKLFAVLVLTLVSLSTSQVATAGYSDLQQLLFRGMEYAGNHNYVSQPQNGPLYDYNSFTQRLEYNRMGQGYTYESYTFYGPDSFGNPNTLDLGPLKVELGQDGNLLASGQPIGIHNRVGYTKTIIPELFFDSQTGQRNYNQFSGVSNFAPAPLHYKVTVNTGVQDFEWNGNGAIDLSGRINALGFYDFKMRLTNVGNYEANGVLLQDEQVTDFDLGPINASGNIMFDAISGALQAVGAQVPALPTRIYSGAANRDKKTDDLLARLNAGETLSDQDMQYLVEQMIEAAFKADPLGVLQHGLPEKVPGFEGLSLALSATPTTEDSSSSGQQVAPEAGTVGLIGAGLAAIGVFLRRRRLR